MSAPIVPKGKKNSVSSVPRRSNKKKNRLTSKLSALVDGLKPTGRRSALATQFAFVSRPAFQLNGRAHNRRMPQAQPVSQSLEKLVVVDLVVC
jgi:hypothetical protein